MISPTTARSAFALLLSSALLVGAILLSVGVGSSGLSPGEVLSTLFGGGTPTSEAIVLRLRLPRSLLAGGVGAGLALSGAVFQALLRNPLAEPYVLGISGGAAVGAVSAIVLGWTRLGVWILPAVAYVGALATIVLVLRIASAVGPGLNTRVLILAGVVVGAFFNAVILLLLSTADVQSFRSAIFWMMGRFSGASWSSVWSLFAFLIPCSAVLVALARPLNLLAVGEETAGHLGVRVESVRRLAYLVTSLLVAAAVAVSGVIGFVGLIVPHGVRLLTGSDHRLLLPTCLLGGGAFLVFADTLARTINAPAELPTGVVTALVGVPMFVVLLLRRGQ